MPQKNNAAKNYATKLEWHSKILKQKTLGGKLAVVAEQCLYERSDSPGVRTQQYFEKLEDSINKVWHYIFSPVSYSTSHTLQHKDSNDRQLKSQRYPVTVSWLIKVNGWVWASTPEGRSPHHWSSKEELKMVDKMVQKKLWAGWMTIYCSCGPAAGNVRKNSANYIQDVCA